MSAEDLAIDVGIPVNTDEFDTFVSCDENIIDHGCGYSSDVTAQICEKCETSDLPIAKKVLRECRRASANTSRMRPEKLKWWQTWRSKRESRDVPPLAGPCSVARAAAQPPAKTPNVSHVQQTEEEEAPDVAHVQQTEEEEAPDVAHV